MDNTHEKDPKENEKLDRGVAYKLQLTRIVLLLVAVVILIAAYLLSDR